MQNRARLLEQYQTHPKKQASYVVKGNTENRKMLHQHNREQMERHPEWFPAPLKAGNRHQQALTENNHSLSNDYLHNITEATIHHPEQQLGKPYVWSGTRPDRGFNCGGLVSYAYSKILETKLPHTANETHHYHRTTIIASNGLRRGDLLLFHIHSHEIADHVGMYPGDGQFIKSLHVGKNIRINRLVEPFWQDHSLDAWRILTEGTILQARQGVYTASGDHAQMPDTALARLIISTDLCVFASRFPVIPSPHYRLFLFFLSLEKRSHYV